MKQNIHPTYHTGAKITCACGNVLTTGSTQKDMHVEICGACHPFYTGTEKLVDTRGRVERFRARAAAAKDLKTAKKPKTRTKKEA